MMWLNIVFTFLTCYGPWGAFGEGGLSRVWDEIVAKSADTPQCQTCVHLRNYLDQTLPDHEIKSMRIEALKQTILKRLGMTQPPKFSTPNKPLPRPIKDGTLSLEKYHMVPSQHVTERVIMLFSNHECTKEPAEYKMSLTLEIPANLRGIDISGANMWLYTDLEEWESCVMSTSSCSNEDQRTQIVPIEQSSFKGSFSYVHLINTRHQLPDGWSKMDITWTLSNWLEFGTLCHQIVLTCNIPPRICEDPVANDPSKKPFIHVDIAPNSFQVASAFDVKTSSSGHRESTASSITAVLSRRPDDVFTSKALATCTRLASYDGLSSKTKREKRNVNCGKGTTECCRESLQVSFKDIGWDDWVIQPTDYNAYFCKGTCANAATISLSKAPYHTIMRKYNLISHRHLDIIPCCTPARLSPLQVIYKDQNNTIFQRIIQDLTVESCGCM